MQPKCILIAGASGFVGRSLMDRLLIEFPDASIVALSRSVKPGANSRLTWRQCDLFSVDSISKAFPEKVDLVYYLVHSMAPTAQLDQGSFADYDLLMADNFARACRAKNVQQLVYLGGLIPDCSELSLHLQSRLEVENVFEEHKVPYTFFRAGLIIGEEGSSFQILLKLITRLHVMICPSWTQTLTSPVDLRAVVGALVAAAKSEQHLGRTYDLAGCRPLTYLNMMRLTAQHLGLRRFFFKVPFFSPTLSRLWVSLITNTSRNLVYPLIESLQHPMVARDSHIFDAECRDRDYLDLLRGISTQLISKPFRFGGRISSHKVRSVQRIRAVDQSATIVAETYFRWLPEFTKGLIAVVKSEHCIQLRLCNRINLIELHELDNPSADDWVTYAIREGVLVSLPSSARMEFRMVLHRSFAVVAIHDYVPSLPWIIYRFTQAQAHSIMMKAFSSFLMTAKRKKLEQAIELEHVQTRGSS
ncbi:MAG: NAD-dependent epimerase/dehydratase family protein [Bdellovibrionales bacterium]|nr:NAD-dependent epimerase/dehydratase family protein [Bdellovibrionales bacterium]